MTIKKKRGTIHFRGQVDQKVAERLPGENLEQDKKRLVQEGVVGECRGVRQALSENAAPAWGKNSLHEWG